MRQLKHHVTLFLAAVLLTIAVSACQSLALEPAQTFNDKLAYAVATHTAVLQATTSAVTAGTLSSDEAATVLKGADNAKLALDAAKAAHEAGDEAGANTKLATALTALQALQDYLRSHGGAK
jgi:hypothetical protein